MIDRWIIRMIVGVLGCVAIFIVLGGIWLADREKSLTDALIAYGAGAIGGLSTFLVSTRSGGDSAQAVTVPNTPAEPVPTTEATPLPPIVLPDREAP
jgi:hypothetical protein